MKTLKDVIGVNEATGKKRMHGLVLDDDLRTVAREWIIYLEKESTKTGTKYPREYFQVEWIREFFNLEEE